jgi:cytochrome c556
MDALEEQVGPVDAASAGKVSNLEDLKSRAYLINTLLAAFPHLFPAGSMPADIPEDGTQTSATPAVWDKFDAFYDLSRTAASAAYDASQAKDEASFRTHAAALRKACDACHAQFMAAPASPEPPPK